MSLAVKSVDMLKAIFDQKVKRNGSYSLRAFSKSIGLSHSTVSGFFNGALPLTSARAKIIAEKLSLGELEKGLIISLAALEQEADPEKRKELLQIAESKIAIWKRNRDSSPAMPVGYGIDAIHFILILKLGNCPKSATELSLVIKKDVAYLEQMVVYLRDERWIEGNWGNFVLLKDNCLSNFAADPASIKLIYQKILDLTLTGLDHQNPNERVIGFESYVIDPILMPELKKLTFAFLDGVAELSIRSENPTMIVHTLASSVVAIKRDGGGR